LTLDEAEKVIEFREHTQDGVWNLNRKERWAEHGEGRPAKS